MKTRFLTFSLLLLALGTFAQQSGHVYLSGTRFTYPLIEKWIAEYSKTYPNANIRLLTKTNDSVNVTIIAHYPEKSILDENKDLVTVSRFALLPVASEKNLLAQKTLKKGIKKEDLQKVFFEDAEDDLEQDKSQAHFQVYTRASKVCSSITFAKYFGNDADNIVGKGISGDDKHLLDAIRRDSLGITYNNLGFIYDLQTRSPLKGFSVIPIDLNSNGKLDKDEQIYENLDLLVSYLEKNPSAKSIPTEKVFFITPKNSNNQELKRFTAWVQREGQAFSNKLGFISLGEVSDNKSAYLNIKSSSEPNK